LQGWNFNSRISLLWLSGVERLYCATRAFDVGIFFSTSAIFSVFLPLRRQRANRLPFFQIFPTAPRPNPYARSSRRHLPNENELSGRAFTREALELSFPFGEFSLLVIIQTQAIRDKRRATQSSAGLSFTSFPLRPKTPKSPKHVAVIIQRAAFCGIDRHSTLS